MSAIERLREIQQDLWRLAGARAVAEQHLLTAYGEAWPSHASEGIYAGKVADADQRGRPWSGIRQTALNLDDPRDLIEAMRYLSALEALRRGLPDDEVRRLDLIANSAHHTKTDRYREGDEQRVTLWVDRILANVASLDNPDPKQIREHERSAGAPGRAGSAAKPAKPQPTPPKAKARPAPSKTTAPSKTSARPTPSVNEAQAQAQAQAKAKAQAQAQAKATAKATAKKKAKAKARARAKAKARAEAAKTESRPTPELPASPPKAPAVRATPPAPPATGTTLAKALRSLLKL